MHALHDPTEGGLAGGVHELYQAAAPEDAGAILHALKKAGIHAARIGTLERAAAGVMAVLNGEERPLPRFSTDELARVL